MIMGQLVAGPWAGAGLGGLEQGADFNCTSTMCYGIKKAGESAPGAAHQTLVNLQRAINRWSGKASFTSVVTDGFVGHATVDALQKAGNALLGTLPGALATIAKNLFAKNLTKENVAANAVTLTESLNSAADKLEAAGSLPAPIVPSPNQPPATANTNTTPNTANLPGGDPSKSSGLIWWLLGGFAVVATAGIATAVVLKRRKRSGSSMSMRPGRRSAHAF